MKPVDPTYTHKKVVGAVRRVRRDEINADSSERGGFQLSDEIKGGNVPKEIHPSGLREHANTGSDWLPIIDFEVHLVRWQVPLTSTGARVRNLRGVMRKRLTRPASSGSSRS